MNKAATIALLTASCSGLKLASKETAQIQAQRPTMSAHGLQTLAQLKNKKTKTLAQTKAKAQLMTKMQNKIKAKQDEAVCTDYYSAEECDEFYAWYETQEAESEWDCYDSYSAEECADFYGAEEGGELAQTSSKTTTKAKVATKAKMQLKLKTKEDSACADYGYTAEECDEFYAWLDDYYAGNWDCYAQYSEEECYGFYNYEEIEGEDSGELAQTSSKTTTKAKIAAKAKMQLKLKTKEDGACTDYYSAEECTEFYAWIEEYYAGEWDCYAEYSTEECEDFYGAEEGGELAQTSSKATTKAKIAIKVKAAAKAKSATKAKQDDDCGCDEIEACEMICFYDADGTGTVNFDEFMAAEKEMYGDELEYTNAEYQEFFDSFDLDGNGGVDQAELEVVLGSWDAVMEEIYEQCGDDEACWEEAFADL